MSQFNDEHIAGPSLRVLVLGRAVAVNANGATIHITKEGAIGLFAQSIGGGGNGGVAGGIVSFGSSGAAGGNGGVASVTNGVGASISTSGDQAFGVLAQGVGGGNGGFRGDRERRRATRDRHFHPVCNSSRPSAEPAQVVER